MKLSGIHRKSKQLPNGSKPIAVQKNQEDIENIQNPSVLIESGIEINDYEEAPIQYQSRVGRINSNYHSQTKNNNDKTQEKSLNENYTIFNQGENLELHDGYNYQDNLKYELSSTSKEFSEDKLDFLDSQKNANNNSKKKDFYDSQISLKDVLKWMNKDSEIFHETKNNNVNNNEVLEGPSVFKNDLLDLGRKEILSEYIPQNLQSEHSSISQDLDYLSIQEDLVKLVVKQQNPIKSKQSNYLSIGNINLIVEETKNEENLTQIQQFKATKIKISKKREYPRLNRYFIRI